MRKPLPLRHGMGPPVHFRAWAMIVAALALATSPARAEVEQDLPTAGLWRPVVGPATAEDPVDRPAHRAPAVTRGDPAFDAARARFDAAAGRDAVPAGPSRERAFLGRTVGRPVLDLAADVEPLVRERGWRVPANAAAGSPHSSGARLRTMIGIARAGKLPPAVGAMQAIFGTPEETGVAALERRIEAARAAGSRRAGGAPGGPSLKESREQLKALLAGLPPGPRNWPRADLDRNDDGRIDRLDIAARTDGAAPASTPAASRRQRPAGSRQAPPSLSLDQE